MFFIYLKLKLKSDESQRKGIKSGRMWDYQVFSILVVLWGILFSQQNVNVLITLEII